MSQRRTRTGSTTRTRLARLGGVLVAAAVVAVGCSSPEKPRPLASPDESMQNLETIVRQRVDSGRSRGIVAGMVFADGTQRIVAYGAGMDAASVFEIGSITKTFTATVLSDMVERGEVRLGDPVVGLLPAGVSVPSRHGRQITLEDLATHTSGLPRNPSNLEARDPENPYAAYTADHLYRFLGGYTLPRDPGSNMEYSNVGFGLLGHALALRAGTSYEELVRSRVLGPLGLPSTGTLVTPAMAGHLAVGHDADGRAVPGFDFDVLAGAGALRSSITDMLSYAAANLDAKGGPLHTAMAAARKARIMHHAGLAWDTRRSGGIDIVSHGGATGGFSAFLGLDEARQTAVVVLSASKTGVEDIGLHLLDPRRPVEQDRTITLAADVLQTYAGVYEAGGEQVRIEATPEGLTAALPAGLARLYPESRTSFAVRVAEVRIDFQLDSKGRVTGAVMLQDGEMTKARKIA